MTKQTQDPLVETLMQLAASAAPLIRRARESGMFNADMAGKAEGRATNTRADDVVDAEVVDPKPKADSAALEAILVRQALRIAELEAEVTALKAKAKPTTRKRSSSARKPAARKKPAK
jgi:hypothetical protein